MTPIEMIHFVGRIRDFKNNHPEIIGFLKSIIPYDTGTGSVMEISVSMDGGADQKLCLKLTRDDLETLRMLKGF